MHINIYRVASMTCVNIWTHYNKHRRVKEYLLHYNAVLKISIHMLRNLNVLNISTINTYITLSISQIHVYKHTTHILHTYSNIPISQIEASFYIISHDLFPLIWIHISNLQ
jgi:hypothetical protein